MQSYSVPIGGGGSSRERRGWVRPRGARRAGARSPVRPQGLHAQHRQAARRRGGGWAVLHGSRAGREGPDGVDRRRPDRNRRSQRREAVQGPDPREDQRVRASGARRQELLRPALGAADRHQDQSDGGAVPAALLEGHRGAHRPFGRVRRARGVAGVDPGPGRPRRDRRRRRVRQEVQGAGLADRHSPPLPRPREVQGQDVGLLRRRRRLDALLPQGRLRRREAEGRVQGEVQAQPARAADLGRVRRDGAVHHRPAGAEGLRHRHGPRPRQPGQPVLLLPAVPGERRPVLPARDDEGADQQRHRRQDDAPDPRAEQGVDPGHREARLRLGLGELAPGEDGDDDGLAADGPDLGELRAAEQGVRLPAEVEDRRQGRVLDRAGPERRARGRVREGRLGRLEEQGGGVPVHAVGDEPVRLAPARAAAVHAARPVSALALHVQAVPQGLARREGVPPRAVRGREPRRARPDHVRRGGLRECARPLHDLDLRRQGREARARRGRAGMGQHHEAARHRQAANVVPELPQAAGVDRAEHRRQEGPGGQVPILRC